MLFTFFLRVGLIFSTIAALIAFFITYAEWYKHRFTGWALWREPLMRAAFTFAIFFALSLAIGLFI